MAKSNKFQNDDQAAIEFNVGDGPIGAGPQGDPGNIDGEYIEQAAHDSTALALQNPNTAPTMDSNDFFIPNLRCAQGLTPEVTQGNAKPGQWLMMGVEPQNSMVVVPIKMTKAQELRDKDTNSTICSSPDAVFGVGNPGGPCGTCPLNQWTPGGPNGKNNPPLCVFKYSYLMYAFTENADGTLNPVGPALFHAKRTGIQTGKIINSFAMMNKGWGKFAIRLTSQNVQDGKKSYAKPLVTFYKMKPDDLKIAQDMAELLTSDSISFAEEDGDFGG